MSFWTPDNVRVACGGVWHARPRGAGGRPIAGVGIDSRTLRDGEVFVALRGERFDGHDFLADAVAGGASLLVVSDTGRVPSSLPAGLGVVKVADTGRALLRLAGAYRRTLEGVRVIAVTGSNGKTTTSRLIHAALSGRLRGSVSQKSYNNAVGVPLTILRARPGDQYLVSEVGINAPGEMADLAEVVAPDVAVITSIGRAHTEGLGGVEGVCREKATLLSFLRPNGCAVVMADAPGLSDYLRPAPNLVTFGRGEHADLRLTSVEQSIAPDGAPRLRFAVNGRTDFEIPLIGAHNALNALAAIAVARRLGLDNEVIAEALRTAAGPEMRLALRRRGDVTVLNDAYNANPDSMLAALRAFAGLDAGGGRRVAVLGDMLELGDTAEEAHREIGDAILGLAGVDVVVAVGPMALHIAERLERDWPTERIVVVPTLTDKAVRRIVDLLRPGDLVLLKASRAVGLERVDDALASRPPAGRPAPARA